MYVRFVRLQFRRNFEIVESSFDIATLEQSLAQLIACVAEIRFDLDHFSHHLDALLCCLLGQQNVAEMILGLNVVRVQSQLCLKFVDCLVELPKFQVDDSRIKMRESYFVVEGESRS